MPPQRSYDVTCTEEGGPPAASSPPTKGPWILRLIGFFVFCIVVLLICLCTYSSSTGHSTVHQQQSPKEEAVGLNGSHFNSTDDKGNIRIEDTSTTTEPKTTKVIKIPSHEPAKQPESVQGSNSTTKSVESTTTQFSSDKQQTFLKSEQGFHSDDNSQENGTAKILTTTLGPDPIDHSIESKSVETIGVESVEQQVSVENRFIDNDEKVNTTGQTTNETTSGLSTSTLVHETTTDPGIMLEKTDDKSAESSASANVSSSITGLNGTTTEKITTESKGELSTSTTTSKSTTNPEISTEKVDDKPIDLTASGKVLPIIAGLNDTTTEGITTESTTELPTSTPIFNVTIDPEISSSTPSDITDFNETTTEKITTETISKLIIPTVVPEITADPLTTKNSGRTESPTPEETKLGSRVASRMLFYMNHSADACEDFYDYACGGFEAEELSSNDLSRLATKRIFDQANREGTSGRSKEFLDYYNSCIAYNKDSKKSEKIEFAKKAIAEVGSFYNEAEWQEETFNLTDLLSKLLLRNSAPIFDITPDVAVDVLENCADQEKPARFTLKLGPSLHESNFHEIAKEHKCFAELKSKTLEGSVDLNRLHRDYTACKNNLQSVQDFLASVRDVLKQLSHLEESDRDNASFSIEKELRPAFPWFYSKDMTKFVDKEEIRKAYVTKDFKSTKIEDLENGLIDKSFLAWTQLLQTLGLPETELQQPLQVYFAEMIKNGLNELYNLQIRGPLHNAFLALYAHKIYYEFVEPPPDVENYCKRIATRLMGKHASNLYLRSFSPEEHANINETVSGIFDGLKTTLKTGLKAATWLTNTDESEIMQKLRDLKIEIPDLSSHQDNPSVEETGSPVKAQLTGEFFKDTMMLEKEYRKSIYGMMTKSPNDYEQTWTYFSLPYETTGLAIHGLNKIVIPYGAIDWPAVWSAQKLSAHHLVLATVGNRIAAQISRHFDSTGTQYFAGKRSSEPLAVFCSDEPDAQTTFKEYIERQDTLDTRTGKIHLPGTSQDVQYTMSDLGLNDRLAEITGLQLVYDTLSHWPPNNKTLLPWLTNQDTTEMRQFFLAYAQMHCTNVPLTSNFVSIYEEGDLPSRMRISAVASSYEAIRNTWGCPKGAGRVSEVTEPPFPHLSVDDQNQRTLL